MVASALALAALVAPVRAAESVGQAASSAAKKTGHAVAETSRQVGHAVAEAGRDVGHATAEAGREVGHETAEAGRKVGHETAEAGRKTGHAVKKETQEGQAARQAGVVAELSRQRASARASSAAHRRTAACASSITLPMVMKPWIWRSKQT